MRKFLISATLFFLFAILPVHAISSLRDHLKEAEPGDWIAVAQGKTYLFLHIYNRTATSLTIQELSVPAAYLPKRGVCWPEWFQQGARGNTCWVIYKINLENGHMEEYYSVTRKGWFDVPEADNFFTTLLNLPLYEIPENRRKRIGSPPGSGKQDQRPLWQPRVVVNGKVVPGVPFTAWKTSWPQDGSDLSGKAIEIYIPEENQKYPSYFPYWLQISGGVGKARARIVDSGTQLESPALPQQWTTVHP